MSYTTEGLLTVPTFEGLRNHVAPQPLQSPKQLVAFGEDWPLSR